MSSAATSGVCETEEAAGLARPVAFSVNQALLTQRLPGDANPRLSRSTWNFDGGLLRSGDVHEVILHDWSDILGSSDLAFEGGA